MERLPLNDWEWTRDDDPTGRWVAVELPHTAVEADADGRGHWQGTSRYRRGLRVESPRPGERHALWFGAAMQVADVLVDGVPVARHVGGYLPFEVDLSGLLADGEGHRVEVRLDHRDDPDVPPGKPHEDLDFCRYGGLYREAELRRYPPVHLTDPLAVDAPLGGGVIAVTREATRERAVVDVSAHVANGSGTERELEVHVALLDELGEPVASAWSPLALRAGGQGRAAMALAVRRPRLWSTASPVLHGLRVEVRDARTGVLLDAREERFGIRTVSFSRSRGMLLNGEPCVARGVNRHQDHPWAGYALPPAAQRRDALRIKAAGLDYVRLSHYPQSPAFLDACDELGILVMNCIPGWQFLGGELFRRRCESDARRLIRRDRNHACVVLWELSLNETPMDDTFIAGMRRVAAQEVPGGGLVTCGWKEGFDVYLRSRQHGRLHTWRRDDTALVVAEYGDWEYYAANEGFDQRSGRGLLDPSRNSRARRADGDARLLRQADNHAEALHDVLLCRAPLSGLWVMFDYARGYDPRRAACGMMDSFRLPKPSFHLYRSQRPATERGEGWGGPMVHVAAARAGVTRLDARVFSNLPEVELFLDGRSLGKRQVEVCPRTGFRHPVRYEADLEGAGVLEAVGSRDGVVQARHVLPRPGPPAALRLRVDDLGVVPGEGEADLLFAHAEVVDEAGTPCGDSLGWVEIEAEGDVRVLGPNHLAFEAGIASFLVRRPARGGEFRLAARSAGLTPACWTSSPAPIPVEA